MSARGGARPAVFLDRDGTLNRELPGALTQPEQLELLPGALAGAERLAQSGFALVLITNQSAIARGWLDFGQLARVHAELARRMAAAGAPLAGLYVCPHHPDAGVPPYRRACACRKPAPGLLRRAARELGLDLAASWLVGDAERDLAAGDELGLRSILVRTGKGQREQERMAAAGRAPQHLAADLDEAARLVLAGRGASQGR